MTSTPAEALRAMPLFADAPAEGLARLAESATLVEVAAGRVLIEVGQPGSGLFVIKDGTLEVDLPDGRTVDLGPGQFVGEIALLTDRAHVARVRAKTDATCYAISRGDFVGALEVAPQIAVAMLPVLAQRLGDSA